jgi:uncharacterized membrane protein YidH (DUF202 family)
VLPWRFVVVGDKEHKPRRRLLSWAIGAVIIVAPALILGQVLPSDEIGEAYAPLIICFLLVLWTVLWAVGLAVLSVWRWSRSEWQAEQFLCPHCGRRSFDGHSCALCDHTE